MTPTGLADAAAGLLVGGARLRPAPLPAALAAAEGRARTGPVTLRATAWTSDRVPWARLVRVEGEGISIGNLLAVAAPSTGAPVLGVDVVQVRPREVIVVADLVPVTGPPPPPRDDLPDWALGRLSPDAHAARIDPADLGAERPRVDDAVRAWLAGLEGEHAPALPRERQAAYLRAHRDDDPGLRLLATWFGAAWAADFLAAVMFPEPSW